MKAFLLVLDFWTQLYMIYYFLNHKDLLHVLDSTWCYVLECCLFCGSYSEKLGSMLQPLTLVAFLVVSHFFSRNR